METNEKYKRYPNNTYNPMGNQTGRRFLARVQKLLQDRNLSLVYQLDAPTESLGNCFPYALMQQLHREEVYSTLSEEMKQLCENYHDLRVAIAHFVETINQDSEYFEIIDEGRTAYITMQIENPLLETWDEHLADKFEDGKWFTDQFVKFAACFLKRHIIIHTATGDLEYCGSPLITKGNM